jgi:iron complex outermembrane receptor protein
VVPGLLFTVGGGFAQPTIRGVSSESTAVGVEQPAAIYLDGAYLTQQSGNIFDLPDIARVEVLKGPQGTNFGPNAVGGAIQVFTLEPTFEPTLDVTLSDGVYDGGGKSGGHTVAAKAFVSGPLSDTVAASLSGYYSYDEGYLFDDLRGQRDGSTRSAALRAKVLLNATEQLSILASAFHQFRDTETNLICNR